ncbi:MULTISPECIES: lysozyme inhibitor LprI family protein [unclassified Inquilinus]|uniref:lysozyme inhibitor LprI family protein n=1 Tax=unclassified Inquilinus TaxID=2645927 RepID=UPI003F91F818
MRARFLLPLLALFATTPALAETAPSFDCDKAGTAVEKAICADMTLSWLDHTMGRLYAALQGSGGTKLRDSQRAWLADRNKCPAEGRANCLSGQYMTRFAALAAGYDKGRIAGVYTYLDGSGAMTAIPFPNGTLAARIDTVGAAPAYPVCMVELEDAPLGKAGARWTDPDSPMGDDKHCSIGLSFSNGAAGIEDHGCEVAYCGLNGSFSGRYQKN